MACEVRELAVLALRHFGHPSCAPALAACLGDPDASVHCWARDGCLRLGEVTGGIARAGSMRIPRRERSERRGMRSL